MALTAKEKAEVKAFIKLSESIEQFASRLVEGEKFLNWAGVIIFHASHYLIRAFFIFKYSGVTLPERYRDKDGKLGILGYVRKFLGSPIHPLYERLFVFSSMMRYQPFKSLNYQENPKKYKKKLKESLKAHEDIREELEKKSPDLFK